MFTSIVARTFELARRWWVRIVVTYLVASTVAFALAIGSVLNLLDDAYSTNGEQVTSGDLWLLPLSWLAGYWSQLATIRASSGRHGIGASLLGGVTAALRGLPLLLVVTVLAVVVALVDPSGLVLLGVLVVLLVPLVLASADIALTPRSFGMRSFFLLGLGRLPRNVPAYLAVLAVLVAGLLVAAALGALLLLIVTGHVTPEHLADSGLGGVLLVQLPPSLLLVSLVSSLAVAIHEEVARRADRSWDDDDEPYRPVAELSPAIERLVGSGPQPTRRMSVPPRAAQPGRVPGPGVLNVAGVDLPAGRSTRSVEAATLELAVHDAQPGNQERHHDDQLWVSREPIPTLPARWKQLAAGFAETGLWPLALPVAGHGQMVDWFEHATRREPDSIRDGSPSVAEVLRSRLSESLDGTPLASTDLLRASHLARGELRAGAGRRTDALTFAFSDVGPARLGLAPARRPADVLHALAWPGAAAAGIPTDELAEVLASWEERYGALLVGLDEATVVLAVLRPPTTLDDAVELAAEQHALCPDEARDWGTDLAAAERLVDAPTWRLSWH